MKLFNSLMTQFVVGAAILVIFILLLTVSQQQSTRLQKMLNEWQNHVDKLQLDIGNLQQQAQHYKLNAPRDFESYNRDVAVFYQQFNQQVRNLNTAFERTDSELTELSDSLVYQAIVQHDSPLFLAMEMQTAWHESWKLFVEELQQKLGDPNEPRLEWGAEFIIINKNRLNNEAKAMAKNIEQGTQWFSNTFEMLNLALIALVLLYLIGSLIVFALRIIRPVSSTTAACELVAGGDYGIRVDVNGSGETRRLQHAFNELSSRSQLMMNMLRDVNKPGDVADKLQCIYDSGRDALGCNWIGLMAFDTKRIDLASSVPATLDANFRHRYVSLRNEFGKEMLETLQTGWLQIDSISKLSLKRHDERFLRELHKNTMAHEIIGYPFRCPQHNNFILLFASNYEDGFSKQQTDLIQALSKLMADAIIAGMSQPAALDSSIAEHGLA